MPTSEFNRDLGKLEGSVQALVTSIANVTNVVEVSRKESDESRRRIYERLEKHERAESIVTTSVTDTLQHITRVLDTHVAAMNNVNEIVAGHGRALVDLEKRLASHEEQQQIARAKQQVSVRWAKGFLSIFMAAEADHMSGWKFAKAVVAAIFGK
jgi:chromosome segregation ATPase